MIFNNNTTSLSSSNIPMDETYNCSYGAALALVESARNDYKMFRAMLDVDARELQIRKESTGYVAESEVTALAEAATGGIWAKIKELFSKLIAKIKGIFHNFVAKISPLWKSDKELVKKYEKELYRKRGLENLEVTFTKLNSSFDNLSLDESCSGVVDAVTETIQGKDMKFYEEWKKGDREDHEKKVLQNINISGIDTSKMNSISEIEEELDDLFIDGDHNDTYELKDIGTIRDVCSYLDSYSKTINTYERGINSLNRKINQIVNEADKKAKTVASDYSKDENKANDMYKANCSYDISVISQDIILKITNWSLAIQKEQYKQYKAIFMKAVTVNEKKLESSLVYANAVAEAAEEEVEDVISGAMSDEEISKLSTASTNVMDSDVSDDPNELVYSPDRYNDNNDRFYSRVDGTIDTDINSKDEAAYFGKLFY